MMKKDFKEILYILLRFLGIWLILFLAYQLYLNQFSGNIDYFTKTLSNQIRFLLNKSGYETVTVDFHSHETVQFYIRGKVATRMVEGCNAISIMIMFLAFIFAFYKGLSSVYFAFTGIILLYLLNLFRIYFLNVIVISYPGFSKAAHDYFFPSVIYGGVVVLWLVWINKFVIKDENS
jgi:exosortase family protein XrtF